ncbi:MAG: peptidyl-prolyl cis-trans isomerase [Acidobacteria bacterium]|nr:peptidyl-prolyl cis-trans isomerase [Acidobacteriota bacterium]
MIKFLQKSGKTQKYLLGGFLFIICAAMVWSLGVGVFTDPGGPQQGDIASIGDQSVTTLEVEQAARNMAKQQFRGNVPDQVLPLFMRSAADQLITQKALIYEARRAGFEVTDGELRDYLHQGQFGELFFPNGNYVGDEAYENMVQNYFQLGKQEFESRLRSDMLWRKLLNTATAGVEVSPADIQKEFQRQNVKVKLEYAVLTNTDMEKLIKPGEAELRKYFDDNKSRYAGAVAEKRKATYVVIDRQKILEEAKKSLTPEQMLAWYNQHQSQFQTQESVNVRHILIQGPQPGPDGKVDQKGLDAARAKAEDVLKQVRAGGNFAELAKKYSDDPGSKEKGGEYDNIQRGTFAPEFEKAAFAMSPGEISGLVQTTFGFHIIQLLAKHPAGVKPFNEVKEQIAQQMAQEKAAAESDALAAKVENEAGKQGMDKAGAENHLQVYHSDFFTHSDNLPGIPNAADFMQAAFNAKVNGPPFNTKMPAGYVIAVVTGDEAARTPGFEEWRSHVEQDFKQAQSATLLAQRSHELADRAHADHDLKKAAKELGASVKTSDLVTMNSQVPDIGSMSGAPSAAFDMNPGEISNAIDTGTGAVVFSVLDKQQPSPADLAKDKEQIREQLLQQKRQQRIESFITDVRSRLEKQGKIKINQQELNKISGGGGRPLTGM